MTYWLGYRKRNYGGRGGEHEGEGEERKSHVEKGGVWSAKVFDSSEGNLRDGSGWVVIYAEKGGV